MALKINIHVVLTFCFLVCASIHSQAQVNEINLAQEYVRNGEFEKALLYLEKLYKQTPTGDVYANYLECLLQTGDFKTAEKIIKQQLKKNERNLFLYTDWIRLYEMKGEEKKVEEIVEELIENLDKNRSYTQRLSKYFVNKQKPEIALQILEKAKELNNGGYGYEFEVAEIKGAMGQYDEMISAYLDLLQVNPSYLNNVRTALLRTLNFDEEPEYAQLIQQEILKKIQLYPQVTTYNEFLIWIQLQQKDFYGAFLQAKALDLRFQEKGARISNIAFLAYNNSQFKTAQKAFEYLVEMPDVLVDLKIRAVTFLLKIEMNDAIIKGDSLAYKELETKYQSNFDTLGINEASIELVLDYCSLLSGKLKKGDLTEQILLNAIEVGNLSKMSIGKVKLALANYYVLTNNVWEASLLYIQVEKKFKEDVLGHEAKLKNALVHYYTGSFEYAQSQLNVLKASTSKLISNDAIELSLLITDNTGLDTITTPLEMFARGDFLLQQKLLQRATETYDSILVDFPGHSLSDEILLRKYEIHFELKKYEEALDFLHQLVSLDSTDILVDKAFYLMAETYLNQLNETELAMKYYKTIITSYANSLYTAEARKKYRKLRGNTEIETP